MSTVNNYTLIISHTDGNHTDTVTFPTKHANIYEKCLKKKKKRFICPKSQSLSSHQMTGASQRASRAVTRACQNSNKQSSAYLSLLFFWDGLILCVTLYATKQCWFFTTKMLFLSIIYSITDANNNSPEEMKRKQMNNHPYYNVIVSLD